jgi:O-antigen ligase
LTGGININKSVYYSEKAGQLSLAVLLSVLSFDRITTLQAILFFAVLCAFIYKKILSYRTGRLTGFITNRPLDILIIISFIWGLVALINAIDPYYSSHEVIHKMTKHYIIYFLAVFMVKDTSFDNDTVRWIFLPLALATAIMSFYACYQFSQYPLFFYNRVSGFTGKFYRLSVFLVLAIPIITVLPFFFRGKLRLLLLAIVPFSIAALFFTFTRAAWIAVVFEGLLLVILLLQKYRKSIFIILIAISVFLSLIAYNSPSYKKLVVHGPRSEGARIEGVVRALDIIKKYPFMGIGYGKRTFSKYYPELREPKHTHNIFLNTAVELGIPGLVFFMAMLVIIIKNFAKAAKTEWSREGKLFFSGIFASISGFIILNCFDYMYHGWPGMMFWAFVGIGLAFIKRHSEPLLSD